MRRPSIQRTMLELAAEHADAVGVVEFDRQLEAGVREFLAISDATIEQAARMQRNHSECRIARTSPSVSSTLSWAASSWSRPRRSPRSSRAPISRNRPWTNKPGSAVSWAMAIIWRAGLAYGSGSVAGPRAEHLISRAARSRALPGRQAVRTSRVLGAPIAVSQPGRQQRASMPGSRADGRAQRRWPGRQQVERLAVPRDLGLVEVAAEVVANPTAQRSARAICSWSPMVTANSQASS